MSKDGFYETNGWHKVRYLALRKYGFKCLSCNRSRQDGVILHVDHVKPRSKYPELSLDLDNLQVLCHSCNYGKSNLFEDDHRRKEIEKCQKVSSFSEEINSETIIQRDKARRAAREGDFIKIRLKRAEDEGDKEDQIFWMKEYLRIQREMKNYTSFYDDE